MAPGRRLEVIALSDSDDETAPGAKKARLKASRASNPALRTSRTQIVDTIDLTGDEELSDRRRYAPPKRTQATQPESISRFDDIISTITRGFHRATADHSVMPKAESPVIPPSDHEDEFPDDPIVGSNIAFDTCRSMRRNAVSTSPGNPNAASPSNKRTRDDDSDSPHAQVPNKRRRENQLDGDNVLQAPASLVSEASKSRSESSRQTDFKSPSRFSKARNSGRVATRDEMLDAASSGSRLAETKQTTQLMPLPVPKYRAVNSLDDLGGSTLNSRHGATHAQEQAPRMPRNQTHVLHRNSGILNDLAGSTEQEGSMQASHTKGKITPQEAPGAENVSAAPSPSAQLQGEAGGPWAHGSGGKNQITSSNLTANGDGHIAGHDLSNNPPQVATSVGIVPDLSGLPLQRHVELIIGKYMQEMRDDTDYFTKARLKRARQSIAFQNSRQAGDPSDGLTSGTKSTAAGVFARRRAINAAHQSTSNIAKSGDGGTKFTSDNYRGIKTSRSHQMARPTRCKFKLDDQDVPGYAHYVSLKSNLLAPNTKTMTVWPYFSEDEPNPNEFGEYYDKDTTQRQRKIRRLLQAQKAEEYVDSALQELNITWNDILQFLLDPSPDVGTSAPARAALLNRDASRSEDFPRVEGSKRWRAVLQASLDSSNANAETLAKAAIFCDNFQRMTASPLWHVARRSCEVKMALDAQEPNPKPVESRTCRICLKFNCTQHGELQEEDSDSDSEVETDDAVVTDIIYPLRRNYRKRMSFPASAPAEEHHIEIATSVPKQRKTPIYWEKGNYSKAGECGPFYPCHHPGVSCADADCSCFINKTPCEKSCSCSSACPRKFQGCSCSSTRHRKSGDLVCMRDERCACYQMGRECDPDLCGSCGVCDVLDPVHRHDDQKSKCHNASIQRGIPKHTLLGDSGVHGMGLYAGQDIKEHEFIGEYKGEVITRQEADRRGAVYEYQDNSYLFMLNTKQEVDSTLYGNKIRFINHRKMPEANVYPLIRLVNTVHRIGLFAYDNIKTGEELFFDYGPKFPEDLLGGKQDSASAQHPRSTKLVENFYEIQDEEDEIGNRRAKKASADGRSRARSRKTDPVKPKKQKGGARPGAGRKPGKKKASAKTAQEAAEGSKQALRNDGPDESRFELPQDRLTAYNISQDKDLDVNGGEDGEDDEDFDPDASEDEAGEQESEDESEENFYMRTRAGRGRPRRLEL